MSAFASLSAAARAFFALWALLLCLADIGSAALAAAGKRIRLAVCVVVLILPAYFLWQVIFDYSLFGGTEKATVFTDVLCGFAWPWWLAVLLLLTAASAVLFARNIRRDRNFITPGTIKLFLDRMPCGVCCFLDSGRVLFSNLCMNELCEAVTGMTLLDGRAFRDAVADGILTVGGKVWRFTCRDFSPRGEVLHELIASDITPEYARTRSLEKDKAELSQLNRELRAYYDSIDDTVRRQEILQAKVNIHDEMNRLMLSTAAADTEDTRELDRIFSLWEQNALIYCMQAADRANTKAEENVDRLADALKIRLIKRGDLPAALAQDRRDLYFCAAREAIVNAFKHAHAKTVTFSFEETKDAVSCHFTNDGDMPEGKVRFTGGLSNLRALAEKQGATVSASVSETFTLTLCFPKDAAENQPFG